jgi:hypothetical protein
MTNKRYIRQTNAEFARAMRNNRPTRKASRHNRNRLDVETGALLVVAVIALIAIGAIAATIILKA